MKAKALTGLALVTALSACGGGGGGGSPLPAVGANPYFVEFSSQVSSLEAKINTASVSALVNPTNEDKKTAKDVVDLIYKIDSYWSEYKKELSDDLYKIKSQTEEFKEAEAIINLLKKDFLSIAQEVAQGKGFDTEVVKKYADENTVQKIIVEEKEKLFVNEITNVQTVAGVEVNRSVGANSNEREVVKSKTKSEETISGGTKTNIKRTKSYTVTNTYEKLFDRTTTIILEDQRIITFADGSTRKEVIATRTKSNTVTLSLGTRSDSKDITEEITYSVEIDKPVEETITEEPIVNVDRNDTYTKTFTDDSGNKVTETIVKPVKTTTIKSKKKITNFNRSTYTYADGHVLVIDEDDTITETALADKVTRENMQEEVIDTKVEVQLVNENTTQETTVDIVEGEPVFVTTHEDTTNVVEADGKKTTTVTRNFTTTVTTTTTTTTTVQKKTVKTYSDGKTETIVHDPEVTTTSEDTVVIDKFSKVISQVIENIVDNGGEIGDDHADMGTRTPGYNSDASSYVTDEYNYITNKQLSVSNFSTAYSRGWTGKNSLITIADTGANVNHTDLNDNIKHTIDYTETSIGESSSHGTHVAGIAGAEKNSSGMHGAAFDADLAIAKVSSGYSYSFGNAKKAAAWGRDKGSVAINVSAEVRYDTGFRNSIVKKTDGEWYSTHWYYGTNGYNGAVNEAVGWKSALGNEQVLVKAAGNAGYDYSAGMNQMATATDSEGNLILDGQMIIVGNWDENNKQINSSSNKAGTVCATYQNNICIDAAKIKDYYIMANGTGITSTAEDGGYVTMTGTSMAAPVVTGSIAVLHQMWPHMKGKHLVQLVLVTGNKNIAGYDENVHGQGLLDMDKATRPVGATGIPTTGRTNGGVSSITGGANISGVSASQMQALTGIMVLDSFERDFYIDLGDMTQSVDTRTGSVAKQMGALNYYGSYMDPNKHAVFPKFILDDNSNIEVGFGTSDKHYLGNSFSGTLGTTKGSSTLYANYNYRDGGFFAQAGLGYSTVNFDTTNSLLNTKTAKVISSTATVGYEMNPTNGHKFGFAVSQPVNVEDAKLNYNVPVGRTLDGAVQHENRTINFKNNKREIDVGTYYTFNIQKTGNAEIDTITKKLGLQGKVNTFAEIRTGVSAIKKEIEKVAGISVQLKF